MKGLLEALGKFASDPSLVGDNLFHFFASITAMNWQHVVAAGLAIRMMADEAWETALSAEKADPDKKALKDPTHRRLRACLNPAMIRAAQLITEAPKEQQAALLASVVGRHGFIGWQEEKELRTALGIPNE